MTDAVVDRVLSAPPPTFTEQEAADIAREMFGLAGAARQVASERDQAFLIDGERATVLKISNAAEDPARLDMEALAAQRVAQIDPETPGRAPAPCAAHRCVQGTDQARLRHSLRPDVRPAAAHLDGGPKAE